MEILSDFSETLKELMWERGLTSQKLGDAIGVSRGNISMWTSGGCKLTLTNAIKLADYFECSLEYLMGLNEKRLDFIIRTCPPFYPQLAKVMKENNVSQYRLIKNKILHKAHFSKWKAGSVPQIETLIRLTKLFNCTLDHLVGREN